MKPFFLFVLLALSIVCGLQKTAAADPSPAPVPAPAQQLGSCFHIDQETGFSYCEFRNWVCLVSKGGQQCGERPVASPTAAPSPSARPYPIPTAWGASPTPKK